MLDNYAKTRTHLQTINCLRKDVDIFIVVEIVGF